MSAAEAKAMLDLYDDPPVGLSYIGDLRDSLAGETCPMCGGENPTTLDHYLTKKKYPEYALLPYNLVPACSCNQRRRESLFDEETGARILHPYYDNCLMKPLISIRFEPDDAPPKLAVEYLLDVDHPSYSNLRFHVANIILKTNFKIFFSKNWMKVRDRPSDILANYSRFLTTEIDFNNYLKGKHEAAFGGLGPNSWHTIFFRSILRRNISDWLFSRYRDRQ